MYLSLAKVIIFSDIRKQFITFLIENLSNCHFPPIFYPKSREMSRFYARLFRKRTFWYEIILFSSRKVTDRQVLS